jgi:acetyl esterase/lipase
MIRTLAPALVLFLCSLYAAEPVTIKLWPKGPEEPAGFQAQPMKEEASSKDGLKRTQNVSDPTITVYRPEKPNGTAVIVAPGGGYGGLAIEHEGTMVCDHLVKQGVTPILLRYRVPRRDPADPSKYPLQDAQRAMGIVRHRAAEWGIKPDRVGFLGFSAGGHLTVMVTLHPNERTYKQDPALDVDDATPNFSVPVYPAYLTTKDTFQLLPEIKVTEKAPPMCLVHAGDDKGVTSSSGSALLYLEYKKLNLPAELHIYTKGGHGFGMKDKGGIPTEQWLVRVTEWMKSMGWME